MKATSANSVFKQDGLIFVFVSFRLSENLVLFLNYP